MNLRRKLPPETWVIKLTLDSGIVYRTTCKSEHKGGVCFRFQQDRALADRYPTRDAAQVAIQFVTADIRNRCEPEEM